jgi:hypothetical protein
MISRCQRRARASKASSPHRGSCVSEGGGDCRRPPVSVGVSSRASTGRRRSRNGRVFIRDVSSKGVRWLCVCVGVRERAQKESQASSARATVAATGSASRPLLARPRLLRVPSPYHFAEIISLSQAPPRPDIGSWAKTRHVRTAGGQCRSANANRARAPARPGDTTTATATATGTASAAVIATETASAAEATASAAAAPAPPLAAATTTTPASAQQGSSCCGSSNNNERLLVRPRPPRLLPRPNRAAAPAHPTPLSSTRTRTIFGAAPSFRRGSLPPREGGASTAFRTTRPGSCFANSAATGTTAGSRVGCTTSAWWRQKRASGGRRTSGRSRPARQQQRRRQLQQRRRKGLLLHLARRRRRLLRTSACSAPRPKRRPRWPGFARCWRVGRSKSGSASRRRRPEGARRATRKQEGEIEGVSHLRVVRKSRFLSRVRRTIR